GSALTYASGALAAGTGTLLLTPVGWLIVGVVLVGGSIYLGFVGDDAKDTPLEQWLDACTFGKRELAGNPPFATLSDEMDNLGAALYAPKLIESDWSDRWGFPHYKAEAKVFLPGYSLGSSHLRILVNGTSIAPVRNEFEHGGRLIEIETFIEKQNGLTKANYEISYRPSDAIAEPYTLR
ncbi:hypothetical protein, partial [Denitromonas iodatirespirans]